MARLPPYAVAALLAAAVLAGCGGPDDGAATPSGAPQASPTPTPTSATPTGVLPPGPPPARLDGEAALALAAGLVDSGGATGRVPGTAGHAAAAAWLDAQVAAGGWTVRWQEVPWADVAALPLGGAAAWGDACPQADRDRLEGVTVRNLVAWREGAAGPRVLLGAHWDSKQDASDAAGPVPGANDGASGVGVLLQLMRELPPDVPLAYNVSVVLFDAEDGFDDCHPLAGSRAYAHLWPDQPDLMVLLDMVGDPEARIPKVGTATGVLERIWALGARHGLADNLVSQTKTVVDDHLPFQEMGVPTVDLIDFARPGTQFPPYWHTTGDTVDKLDATMMGDVGSLVLDLLDEPDLVATAAT